MQHVVHKLHCHIWSGFNNCHILALINSVEEHLRGIQGIEFGGEEDNVVTNDVCCWLAVQSLKLREDELDTHRRIQTKGSLETLYLSLANSSNIWSMRG